MRSVLLILFIASCADDVPDVVGPFTGESRRFVVDSIQLPTSNAESRDSAGDLDGNGSPDNQLGMLAGMLHVNDDLAMHGDDLINAGVIASSVVITADDFANDPTVSVLYRSTDDDMTGIVVGGRLTDGVFEPNRTAHTHVPGAASLRLPVFVDAGPTTLEIRGLEIELVNDGNGGFDAELHGGVVHAVDAVFPALSEMLTSRPYDHQLLMYFFDPNHDGVLTKDEFANGNLTKSFFAEDIELGGTPMLSFGFRVHLSPCASGSCQSPHASCFNRTLDGNEVHLDCGGDCRGCTEGATCSAPDDCESLDCTNGRCGPPNCTNGVRDGLETDVDCGHICSTRCAVGKRCWHDSDCASGQCGEPCDPSDVFCGDDFSYDTCR